MATNRKVKNAPLEASNVAVLLEHIPIGATRNIHSLQVKRVEADHYSVAGGPVIDLVDAMAQIGAYSGKHSNPAKGLTVVGVGGESVEIVAFEILGPFARTQTLDKGETAATVKDDATDVTHLPTGALLYRGDYKTQVKAGMKALRQWFSSLSSHDQKLLTEGYTPGEGLAIPQEQLDLLRQARSVVSGQRQNPKARKSQAELLAAAEKKLRAAAKKKATEERRKIRAAMTQVKTEAKLARAAMLAAKPPKGSKVSAAKRAAAVERLESRVAKLQAKKSNPAAKFERGKPAGGGHREERGYFYEVLNSAGTVVALTTSKDEAQDVCNNPKQLGLPKSEYSFRHIGGKKLVPTTEAGTRARKVK